MNGKYTAYVGSYSYTGKAKGITVYDVDVEKGIFKERCEMEVDNSSYVTVSHNGKNLYSIADEGVVSFRILENGSLSRLNSAKIKGMRGCHLSTDVDDRYVFVSGYHDGKATILRLNKDGSVGRIVDGVFHKGYGSVAERNFRPHVSCTRLTPDKRFVACADLGIDQVSIYRFDEEKLVQVDAVRCERESAPRHFRFSNDGRFMYLMYELKNVIDVYTYETGERAPKIEKIQTISTIGDKRYSELTAACAMRLSPDPDNQYVYCTNAGDNALSIFRRDKETGLLELLCCLPVSGDYPKDVAIFPDEKHVACLNHESGTITFFSVDYEKGLLVMCGREVKVNEPNCCAIVKVSD